MKTRVLSIVAFFMFGAIAVFAANKTESFKVLGNCEMCKARIEKAAKSVDGVSAADWNVETKMLALTFDDSKTDANKVQEAIAKVGHDTDLHKATDEAYNKIASCCKYERAKAKTKEAEKVKMPPME
jgi:periplasmic mercuric ion binding protein